MPGGVCFHNAGGQPEGQSHGRINNFYSVRFYPHFPTQTVAAKNDILGNAAPSQKQIRRFSIHTKSKLFNCVRAYMSMQLCVVESWELPFKLSSFVQIWKLTDISLHKKSHRYDASVWFEGARFGSRISTTRPWSVMQLVGSKFQPRSSFFLLLSVSINTRNLRQRWSSQLDRIQTRDSH